MPKDDYRIHVSHHTPAVCRLLAIRLLGREEAELAFKRYRRMGRKPRYKPLSWLQTLLYRATRE